MSIHGSLDWHFFRLSMIAHDSKRKLFGYGGVVDRELSYSPPPLPELTEYHPGCVGCEIDMDMAHDPALYKVDLLRLDGVEDVPTVCLERSSEDGRLELLLPVAQQQAQMWETPLEIVLKYEQGEVLPYLDYRGGYAFCGGQGYQLLMAPGTLVWLIRASSREPYVSDPARDYLEDLQQQLIEGKTATSEEEYFEGAKKALELNEVLRRKDALWKRK